MIRDPARFGSDRPYPMGSKRYAREFEEVKAVGALAIDRGLRTSETARMFAMMYTTGADTLISVWNDKAKWLFWRPITAIREADRDGNDATEKDTGWLPLINTPPYPDQPPGLSSISAAMAESLERVFGHRVRFGATSFSSGATRSYRSFGDAVANHALERYFERD